MHSCSTIKAGTDCIHMKKSGCGYNGGSCHPVVEPCDGCSNVHTFPDGNFCRVYAEPAMKWMAGHCTMSSNGNGKAQEASPAAKKLNPLKASKRSQR